MILYQFECRRCERGAEQFRAVGDFTEIPCYCGSSMRKVMSRVQMRVASDDPKDIAKRARLDSGKTEIMSHKEHNDFRESHAHANYKSGTLKPANIKEL